MKLEAFTRNEIKQFGQVFLWLKYKDHQKQWRFYVVDRQVAFLGFWESIALIFIAVNVESMQEFPTGGQGPNQSSNHMMNGA